MNRITKIYLSVVTLVFITGVLQLDTFNSNLEAAQVYTWVDAKGEKHYSDRPFKEAKKMSFSVATPKKEVKDTKVEEPGLFDIKDEARFEAECTNAKNNVANLLKGGKLMQKNAEGKEVELTTEQMNEKLAESQAYVKRYCTKGVTSSEG